MRTSKLLIVFPLLALTSLLACGGDQTSQKQTLDTASGAVPASIVGSIETEGINQDAGVLAADGDCPELIVTLNGSPASVVFDEDCRFLISDIQPAESVSLRIEFPALGLSATIELKDVLEGELIEIRVGVGPNSLRISVVRRTEPEQEDEIPEVIRRNNVSILVPAGLYEQDLTVLGNNFTLVGQAGDDCDVGDWTIIKGRVIINGNNATFRNIAFDGTVEVRGNNTHFINCCFEGVLVVFDGHGHGHGDGDD